MPSLEIAQAQLIAKLRTLRPVHFPPLAGSTDMLAARDHLVEVATAVDAYVLAIGQEAKRSTGTVFCADLFENVFSDALAGNALYELEAVAQEIDNHARAGADHD